MNDEKVVTLDCVTRLDLPVDQILDGAKNADSVVVIGYDENGEFFFASSKADGGHALWLLEMAKKKLLEIGDGD